MSEILLPPGILLPPTIRQKDTPDEAPPEQKATALPEPTGWKLLCVVPDVDEKFDNSELVRPDIVRRQEEHATTVLFVLKVGPSAYKDPAKFPDGPWCKAGDFILTRTYSGTRVKIFGKEFRLINDDQVDAVVQDPRGISRAF